MTTYVAWDDSGYRVEIDAVSKGAAAREYVDGGDWGDEPPAAISVWVACMEPVDECAYCSAPCIGVNTDEEAACAEHDAIPGSDIPQDLGDVEHYWISIETPVPTCADGHARDHDWQSPPSVVGGCRENPGVGGHGGGVIIREVCAHCGTYRVTDTWAQDHSTGEIIPWDVVTYEDADDVSSAWVERTDLQAVREALEPLVDLQESDGRLRTSIDHDGHGDSPYLEDLR